MKTGNTQKNKINQSIEQSNDIKMKKTRRFYQNARGLKSKVDSIMKAFSDYQPMLICLVETHLKKEEKIKILGYSNIFCNDGSGNSGSIMLAANENIRTVTLEVA